MKYFLNIIISFLVFIILGFAWSFNVYLKQESPAKNLSQTNNASKEYYLTDAIGLAQQSNMQIKAIKIANSGEVIGINTTDQLKELED